MNIDHIFIQPLPVKVKLDPLNTFKKNLIWYHNDAQQTMQPDLFTSRYVKSQNESLQADKQYTNFHTAATDITHKVGQVP